MSRLDDELRSALRREEPLPDFTDRVMARINTASANDRADVPSLPKMIGVTTAALQEKREKNDWWLKLMDFLQPFQIKWAMAGAMALILLFTAISVSRYRENQRIMAEIAEGERAKEQVMLAMKITSEKLNYAHRKVRQTSDR